MRARSTALVQPATTTGFMRLINVLKRATIWALAGSITGVVIFSVLGGILWTVYVPSETVWQSLSDLPGLIVGSAIWAGYIGLVALPAYTIAFILYQIVVRHYPGMESTPSNRFLSACALGAPPVVILVCGSGSGPHFDWIEALRVFPIAVASFVGGVWLPRQHIAMLRGPLTAPAGQRVLQYERP